MANLLVANLNAAQEAAVTAPNAGALVVLAGPGSGKTCVICHRVAYLVEHYGLDPANIVLVTFTNKAANEMKERITKLLGPIRARSIIMGTFHSTCALLLRRYGSRVGLERDFQIMDIDDCKALMREIITYGVELKVIPEGERVDPGAVLNDISNIKNVKMFAEDFAALPTETPFRLKTPRQVVVYCYRAYEAEFKRLRYMDFDDLLLWGYVLLSRLPEIADQFHHVLVDEFQDTNELQYDLTKLMALRHGRLTIVGDPDQAIYGWRKANVANLTKNINTDYAGRVRVVHLIMGYRSTENIVRSCFYVISQDQTRNIQPMVTPNGYGVPVSLLHLDSNSVESVMVAMEIRRLMVAAKPLLTYGDFAVLVRMQAMTLNFENAMNRFMIPYKIVGGIRFFERLEIKDILAYVRLAANPADQVSFARIINVPPRGIGDVTVNHIKVTSASMQLSCMDFVRLICANRHPTDMRPQQLASLRHFAALIDELHGMIDARRPLREILDETLKLSNYEKYMRDKYSKQTQRFDEKQSSELTERLENVAELLGYASTYDLETSTDDDPSRSVLQRFLDASAVSSDQKDQKNHKSCVVISTLHAAKGLEWPCVFVVGVEANILPHRMSDDHPEERRLLYVGMSRSHFFLYISYCHKRDIFGRIVRNSISPFIASLVDDTKAEQAKPRLADSPPSVCSFDPPQIYPSHLVTLDRILGRNVFADRQPASNVYMTPPDPTTWVQHARAGSDMDEPGEPSSPVKAGLAAIAAAAAAATLKGIRSAGAATVSALGGFQSASQYMSMTPTPRPRPAAPMRALSAPATQRYAKASAQWSASAALPKQESSPASLGAALTGYSAGAVSSPVAVKAAPMRPFDMSDDGDAPLGLDATDLVGSDPIEAADVKAASKRPAAAGPTAEGGKRARKTPAAPRKPRFRGGVAASASAVAAAAATMTQSTGGAAHVKAEPAPAVVKPQPAPAVAIVKCEPAPAHAEVGGSVSSSPPRSAPAAKSPRSSPRGPRKRAAEQQ